MLIEIEEDEIVPGEAWFFALHTTYDGHWHYETICVRWNIIDYGPGDPLADSDWDFYGGYEIEWTIQNDMKQWSTEDYKTIERYIDKSLAEYVDTHKR